ncbi:HD domain-containing protein [methanogenic archaeon mixed culture ISO4-G1]|nr:HD domain-containing protein [methanogenic archaeon mixed culture ISO4-G1]
MDEGTFERAKEFARKIFEGDSSGHDIYHTIRVHDLARTICAQEGGDMDMVRLAALLHDVDDRKLFGDNGFMNARTFMDSESILIEDQLFICDIISQVSFKGKDSVVPGTLEGKIVQDADRMDAIGAIGIARAFAYGGSKGRAMYIPGDAPKEGMSEKEYFSNQGTSVNHFHEKLLLLKDMMNTETAKRMAQHRHDYMVGYLDEFMSEWEGRL